MPATENIIEYIVSELQEQINDLHLLYSNDDLYMDNMMFNEIVSTLAAAQQNVRRSAERMSERNKQFKPKLGSLNELIH